MRFNLTADSLSRRFEDGIIMGTESRYLLVYIWDFVVPQIDLFASRINHQTSGYASWKQDMNASYVDAFLVNWSQFTNNYIFSRVCSPSEPRTATPDMKGVRRQFIKGNIPGEVAHLLMFS